MKHMFDYGIIDVDKKHRIKKADICFFIIILAVSLVIFIIMHLNSTPGSYAIVSYDGNVPLMQLPLGQAETRYFLVTYNNTESGEAYGAYIEGYSEEEWEGMQITAAEYNIFLYQDREIRMLKSSCPDKICVHHRAISETGENIICLPHKLVIGISGDNGHELDGVAY